MIEPESESTSWGAAVSEIWSFHWGVEVLMPVLPSASITKRSFNPRRVEEAILNLPESERSVPIVQAMCTPAVVEAVKAAVASPSALKTSSIAIGVVVPIPIRPVVELITNTSEAEPFCMRTAVDEEMFCWKPPAAVMYVSRLPPEEKMFKRLPACAPPAVMSMPESVLERVESTVRMFAPDPLSTRKALVLEPATVSKAMGEVELMPILPVVPSMVRMAVEVVAKEVADEVAK